MTLLEFVITSYSIHYTKLYENAADAIEFMLAGATAIEVGTAIFIDPTIPLQIVDGINDYLERHNFSSVRDIIGSLQM